MLSSVQRTVSSRLFSSVRVVVDGKPMVGDDGDTIKEFCRKNKIQIPAKCGGHESCMLCNAIVNGKKALTCTTNLDEGMDIKINTKELKDDLLKNIEKMPTKTKCIENARDVFIDPSKKSAFIDDSTNSIQLDHNKCNDCGNCVEACDHNVFLLNPHLQTAGNFGMQSAGCTSCGKCIPACPTKALTITNNIPLYKEAMSAKDTTKIAVLDSAIFFNLEKKLGLKPGSLNLDAVCILLKNMGFDYFLDQSLITDYEIIADAARIYKHGKKGFSQTIGSFCPSMTKKLLKVEPTGAEQVAESFLGPVEQFTTFVVTDCLSRRSNETLYISNPRVFTSVGITTDEFVKIIKEGRYNFNGTPCKMMPLGSSEGVSSVTAERFANSVVGTLGHSFLGAHLPPIQFKDVDKLVSIATFDIAANYTVRVASVKGQKGLDKLYNMNLEDVIYISPKDCDKCNTPIEAIPSIDAESVKRQVKLAMDNHSAQEVWKYFMKQEDDEAFINRPTGYYD